MLWTTPGNQETNAMLIADRQTLAGLYPYMLWATPGNQETNAMLIADRHTWLDSTPYMFWTTPGNQETNAMLIAERQTLVRPYPIHVLDHTRESGGPSALAGHSSLLHRHSLQHQFQLRVYQRVTTTKRVVLLISIERRKMYNSR